MLTLWALIVTKLLYPSADKVTEYLPYAQLCAKPSAPTGGAREVGLGPHESSLIPGPWRKSLTREKSLSGATGARECR